MNARSRHLLFTIVSSICFTSGTAVSAKKIAAPPPKERIADTWIGYNEDDLYYYRLTLKPDGTGLCASTFVNHPAVLYRVTKWTLNAYDLEVTLAPVDKNAEPIWMKGRTYGPFLNLKIGGKELDWERGLKLYRESEVEDKLKRVKARMEQAGQQDEKE